MKIIFLGFLIFLLVILFYLDDNILSYSEEKEIDKIVIRGKMFKIEEYVSGLQLPVMIDFIDGHVLFTLTDSKIREKIPKIDDQIVKPFKILLKKQKRDLLSSIFNGLRSKAKIQSNLINLVKQL